MSVLKTQVFIPPTAEPGLRIKRKRVQEVEFTPERVFRPGQQGRGSSAVRDAAGTEAPASPLAEPEAAPSQAEACRPSGASIRSRLELRDRAEPVPRVRGRRDRFR